MFRSVVQMGLSPRSTDTSHRSGHLTVFYGDAYVRTRTGSRPFFSFFKVGAPL